MEGLSTPLVAATVAFLLVVLWRVRPALPFGPRRRASREALREAKQRIEASANPKARALALCDAADLMVRGVGGASSATGLYLRAMRTDPQSAIVVGRAVTGLSARPRALESLLWRHLAQAPWSVDSREATRSVLDALRVLHEGPLKNAIRARALSNARDAL
ncbi:MAG TPA: hypothetical protein VK762_12485 [Polyangiaceae bacterium]|jgi:hypothetical protein|nr:hypothetical protein [Polyangiaceae bacterium]